MGNIKLNKSEGKMEYKFSAIVVGRVGTWAEIQNVLLGVRSVGNVKGKIILLCSVCKPKPKNQGVNQVQEELEANRKQVDYAFRVTNEAHSNLLKLSVGGVELDC